MGAKYNEYKNLNLPQISKDMLKYWEENKIFEKTVSNREGKKPFNFYEGPPSANGLPGIHHVMARTIKDIFCRYRTLKGFQVKRKGGWDTHGLPIELAVEKTLGITKEDIGKKISIEDYNKACRKEVMKYKNVWDDLTKKMGYWVDLENPYITFENNYIESVWHLLKQLYEKNLLYKGYTIQPYSPAAGTGLSTHELNQPGCYRNVKDTSAVAQFKVIRDEKSEFLFKNVETDIYFLAWTTTPWTLPSNTALAVGKDITYLKVKTFNPYTYQPIIVILALDTFRKYFPEKNVKLKLEEYKAGDKNIPYQILQEVKGSELEGIRYEQLLPFSQPKDGDAFRVLLGDFVTTEDGTGIVHLAPSFGADDFRVAKQNGIGSLTLVDKQGKFLPEVNDGIFLYGDEYVKEAYLTDEEKKTEFQKQKRILEASGKVKELKEYLSADERVVLKLQEEGKLFKKEKYEHSYPHCWRTDKPILYYPLDSWFVKVTDKKEEMIRLNKTINWKPESTGTGRFGEWLNNLQDWNLSRSRFWGIPLPIWEDMNSMQKICIGSFDEFTKDEINGIDKNHNKVIVKGNWFSKTKNYYELEKKILEGDKETWNKIYHFYLELTKNSSEENAEEKKEQSIDNLRAAISIQTSLQLKVLSILHCFHYDFLVNNDYLKIVDNKFIEKLDFHKPYIDDLVFLSREDYWKHKTFVRESDLIDVWFDSGAMPYAQWHYPFENKEEFKKSFPADFIAEGVDQTRGWFYTLHAIAAMLFDSVAFKNVVSNGLVLDKGGNKMSKRLGNAVEPFETIEKYGADATRWYMITNAQPWDNLKFDVEGIGEVQRGFFRTLYNTYAFFALYANIDGFTYKEKEIPIEKRPEIDRWILSELNSLIKNVDECYHEYEPTKAGRALEHFVDAHLSNWYVRLCRRRFWKGDYSEDKIAAYQTLYKCLETVLQLASPIAPFFTEKMFLDLNQITKKHKVESVHLTDFPKYDEMLVNKALEERMELAQNISSMVLSLRKKVNIRVRQPLNKIMIPLLEKDFKEKIEAVKTLILSEVNVKELEYITDTSGILVKKIKPNFKELGKKVGGLMKSVAAAVNQFTQQDINKIEQDEKYLLTIDGKEVEIVLADVEITSEDIPGWLVTNMGKLAVALDITITQQLKEEGIARELVNRIQNLRKDKGFEVTDKITLEIQKHENINAAISNNLHYICSEILATSLELVNEIKDKEGVIIEVDDDVKTLVTINKYSNGQTGKSKV